MNKPGILRPTAALFLAISLAPATQAQSSGPQPPLQTLLQMSASQYSDFTNSVQETEPLAPEDVPQNGIFYSMQFWPPSPFNWLPALPVFSLGTGTFIIDDVSVDYSQAGPLMQRNGGQGREMMDGGGGSGGSINGGGYSFDTNGLYLQITGIDTNNDVISLDLNNATNEVYAIWSATNALADWNVEAEVWPTNSSVMPFTVQTLGQPSLYMVAQDWTGVTNNGNSTPDWWFYYYFGGGWVGLSDTNSDADGHTLLYDYQHSLDPNVISFTPSVTNLYVNNTNMPVQLEITGGIPYYVAAVVDNTNFASAVWQPYPGTNIFVPLGSVEGWHAVWIGLRGLPPNATQTWQYLTVNLDLSPPVLNITSPIINPSGNVTSQPFVELQGTSDRPIGQISYNIQNSIGTLSNLPGTVTGQIIDTNTSQFSSNTFECFDVALTNGLNTIDLCVTDRAGNVTTTNIQFTLDFSGDTTPPAITMFWPLNGDTMTGNEFALRGSLDDFTASISAQIVDTTGDTNFVDGLVERNGLFWVEDVPLAAGTNYITLTAMDAAGNYFVTTLTNNNVESALTINDFSSSLGGDPRNIIPIVTGSTTLSNYTIWVNGIQATQDGQGNWEAQSVPVGPGGTAVVDARAIPNSASDNNGAGTGTTAPSDGTPVNPTASDSIAAELEIDQPPACYIQKYHYAGNYAENFSRPGFPEGNLTTYGGSVDTEYGNGGKGTSYLGRVGYYGWLSNAFNWPCDQCPATEVSTSQINDPPTTNKSTVDIYTALQYCQSYSYFGGGISGAEVNLNLLYGEQSISSGYTNLYTNNDAETITSQMTFQAGGKGLIGQQDLYAMAVSAWSYTAVRYAPLLEDVTPTPVPPSAITVAGLALTGSNQAYLASPGNITMDVTPQIPAQMFTYSVTPILPKALESVTIASNSAVQLDSTNFGAVEQGGGWVILQANLANTNALSLLRWKGGVSGVAGLAPNQCRVPKTPSEKMIVTASVGSQTITVNVWIIWATVNYQFTNATPTNVQYLWNDGPFDLFNWCPGYDLGVQLYTNMADHPGVWAYAKECTTISITPAGIHTVNTTNNNTNAWTIYQYYMVHEFKDGIPNTNGPVSFYFDDWEGDGRDNGPHPWRCTHFPDTNDLLYTIDAPNIGEGDSGATNSYEVHQNYQNYVYWNGVPCSPSNYWHFNAGMNVSNTPIINPAYLGGDTNKLPSSPQY